SEQPAQASPLSYLTSSGQAPCGRAAIAETSGLDGLTLAAFGAKPEVELTETISASYALVASDDRTIAAVGQGEVSGPADAGDIVISPSDQTDFPPTTPAKIDSGRVLRAL